MNDFNKYNFKEYIYKGLESIGFNNPTEIQEKIIPLALSTCNVIGKSQTGTGKTAIGHFVISKNAILLLLA